MRISETFVAPAPPEVVFDYMTDPANLASWQTTKTLVEPLTEGPTRLGSRVRERTKPPGGREFEQIVEFTEFDRPRRFRVHIVEGLHPIDGMWSFQPHGAGSQVTFVAEGEFRGWLRWIGPLARFALARQFAVYHRNLCRNLARAAPG
jgi:uncharacterized protein YndB with AHSA1/START domain